MMLDHYISNNARQTILREIAFRARMRVVDVIDALWVVTSPLHQACY